MAEVMAEFGPARAHTSHGRLWAGAGWPGIGGMQATMDLPSSGPRKASGSGCPQPLCQMIHLQMAGNNRDPLAF